MSSDLEEEFAALAARKGRRSLTARTNWGEESRWGVYWSPNEGRYYFRDAKTGESQWEPPPHWAEAFETLPEIQELSNTPPECHAAAVKLHRFLKLVGFKNRMRRDRQLGLFRAAGEVAPAAALAKEHKSALQRRREKQENQASQRFVKHFDDATSQYYFVLQPDSQHPKGFSTWDKPHRPIKLERPPQERRAGLAIEAAIRKRQKEMMSEERRILLRIRRRDYDLQVKQAKREKGAAEESHSQAIWNGAFSQALLRGGGGGGGEGVEVSVAWQKLGDLHEDLCGFEEKYGRPLGSLRLVGHALTALPLGPGPENMFVSRSLQHSLTSLNLSSNALARLPDEVCRLKHLRVLNLLRNRLEVLPQRFGDLGSSLQELQLSRSVCAFSVRCSSP